MAVTQFKWADIVGRPAQSRGATGRRLQCAGQVPRIGHAQGFMAGLRFCEAPAGDSGMGEQREIVAPG